MSFATESRKNGLLHIFSQEYKGKDVQQPLENWASFKNAPFDSGGLEEPQFLQIQSSTATCAPGTGR
jgi:hypothetical protein